MRLFNTLVTFVVCAMTLSVTAASVASAEDIGSAPPHLSSGEVNMLMGQAQQMGSVKAAEAVTTTASEAPIALDQGNHWSGVPATPVDLVVMHGSFTDTLAAAPPGGKAPGGSTLAYIVEPETGVPVATYVGDQSPDLVSLGAVEQLTPPSTTASIARRMNHRSTGKAQRKRIARKVRRKRKAKAAIWGNNCRTANGYHCYAIAEWEMSGGEQVWGTQSEDYTENMNVPGWESGAVVDDEEWVTFKGNGYWLESGQQGGYGVSCCTLHWFFAWNTSAGFFVVYYPPYTWEVGFDSWNLYAIMSIGGGEWCIEVGSDNYCKGGFPETATRLQDGMEVATESKPTNDATTVANAYWGGSYHAWYNKTVEYSTTPGLCVRRYLPPGQPGNISYGAYC